MQQQQFQPQQQLQPPLQAQPFQPQGALPPGWNEYNDPSTGNSYYNNAGTGETTWTRPAPVAMGGFGAAPQPQLMMVGGEAWVQGTVKNWDDEKGFGFIDPVAGGDNVFVHRSALTDGSILEKGGNVQFVLSWNPTKNKHQVAKCMGAKQQAGGMGQPFGQPMAMGQPGPAMPVISNQPPEGAMAAGTVKTWFDDKGFGFITPSDGSKDCYVHRTFLLDGGSLVVGSTVQYTIQFDPAKNKNNATKVTGAVPGDAGGKGGGPVPGGGKGGFPMPAGIMGEPGGFGGFGQAPMDGFGDMNRSQPYQPM